MASTAFPLLAKTLTVKDGTKYGYIKISAKENKPTLLFLHGYPSSSYHWHYQVVQCQEAGYGAIIPDLLGYGDTDAPSDIQSYDNTLVARQVICLLDHEGFNKVVAVAHDWGSILLSVLARHYASRFSLLIFLAVGYSPSQAPYTDIEFLNNRAIAAIGRPVLGYWPFHNSPSAASIIENADPACLNSLLFPADPDTWIAHLCAPGGMAAWLQENRKGAIAPWITVEQLEIYGNIMKKSGFTGPLNWYKQAMAGITASSESSLPDSQKKIHMPTLFIGAERDAIRVPGLAEATMKQWVTDLTVKSLYTGHWTMLEAPDKTWELIDSFVKARP